MKKTFLVVFEAQIDAKDEAEALQIAQSKALSFSPELTIFSVNPVIYPSDYARFRQE